MIGENLGSRRRATTPKIRQHLLMFFQIQGTLRVDECVDGPTTGVDESGKRAREANAYYSRSCYSWPDSLAAWEFIQGFRLDASNHRLKNPREK